MSDGAAMVPGKAGPIDIHVSILALSGVLEALHWIEEGWLDAHQSEHQIANTRSNLTLASLKIINDAKGRL